jgi:hypothetical protein
MSTRREDRVPVSRGCADSTRSEVLDRHTMAVAETVETRCVEWTRDQAVARHNIGGDGARVPSA